MSRVLTLLLLVHWAVVFSLLAMLAVFGGTSGASDGLGFFGIGLPVEGVGPFSASAITAGAAVAFAFCAVLFWWAFVVNVLPATAANRDGDDVLRTAFAAASGLMTLILMVGAAKSVNGLFPTMAAHYAALIASFVAIRAEQTAPAGQQVTTDDEFRLAARVRAIDASQSIRRARAGAANDTARRWDR